MKKEWLKWTFARQACSGSFIMAFKRVGRQELNQCVRKRHHWTLMAEVSVRGEVFVEWTGEKGSGAIQDYGIALSETIRLKR